MPITSVPIHNTLLAADSESKVLLGTSSDSWGMYITGPIPPSGTIELKVVLLQALRPSQGTSLRVCDEIDFGAALLTYLPTLPTAFGNRGNGGNRIPSLSLPLERYLAHSRPTPLFSSDNSRALQKAGPIIAGCQSDGI